MAKVNTYLNFLGKTEEAFNFYKKIFGTEFISVTRMKDMPRPAGAPALAEADSNKIMNIQLPITNGHVLMATDALGRTLGFMPRSIWHSLDGFLRALK